MGRIFNKRFFTRMAIGCTAITLAPFVGAAIFGDVAWEVWRVIGIPVGFLTGWFWIGRSNG